MLRAQDIGYNHEHNRDLGRIRSTVTRTNPVPVQDGVSRLKAVLHCLLSAGCYRCRPRSTEIPASVSFPKARTHQIDPKATPAARFIEWLVLSAADIRALLLLEMSRIRKISISPRPRTVRSPDAAQDLRRFDLIGIAIDQAQAQYSMGAMLDSAK